MKMEYTKRQLQIIDAAIGIIAGQGLEKLTTKNLAAEIGITEAALYRHFENKTDMIRMILGYFEQISCRVLAEIREAELDPLSSISRFVLDRYELFSQQPALAKVMFSEEIFRTSPAFTDHYQQIMHKHRNEVIAYIEKGQAAGLICSKLEANQIFRIVVGSMRFIVMQWNLSGQRFDLVDEGTKLLNTIKELIEVKQ